MSQLIGTITRKVGNTIVEAQQTAQGNVGCFVARSANGVKISDFRNFNDARRAVEQTFGRQLRWTREDLRGSIEHWVARGALLDPLDIYGPDNLLEWNEMDVGVQLEPGTSEISLVGDQARHLANLTQPTPALSPTLATGPGGLPTADFETAVGEYLSAPAVIDPVQDLSISVLATWGGGAVGGDVFESDTVTALLFGVSTASGNFYMVNSLGPADGPDAPVVGQAYLFQLVYHAGPPTRMELYVNGTLEVANAGTFTANTLLSYLGGLTNPWDDQISLLVIARDASPQNRALMLAYATKRYLQ